MQLQAWTTSSGLYGSGHGAHSAHQASALATEPIRSPTHLQDSSQPLPSVPAGRLVSQQLAFPSLREASVSLMVSCLYFLPSQHLLHPPALFNSTHMLSCTPGQHRNKGGRLIALSYAQQSSMVSPAQTEAASWGLWSPVQSWETSSSHACQSRRLCRKIQMSRFF